MFGARYVVAGAIGGYQRWISPYKGFHCAHWALHGGESCSAFGKRLVIERGVRKFFRGMRDRFDECHRAARALRARREDAGDGDDRETRRKRANIGPCEWAECVSCDQKIWFFRCSAE